MMSRFTDASVGVGFQSVNVLPNVALPFMLR
jgi:hypothetical protein